jgi:hypothetical protein
MIYINILVDMMINIYNGQHKFFQMSGKDFIKNDE